MMSSVEESTLPLRFGRLRAKMVEEGIDALVLLQQEHIQWLSKFNSIITSHPGVIVVTQDNAILLVSSLRATHAEESSFLRDIRYYGDWFNIPSVGATWSEALVTILTNLGVTEKTIGLEYGSLVVEKHKLLRKILPKAKFVDVGPGIKDCRHFKDEDELENMRLAGKFADVGLAAVITSLKAGATEREASLAGEHAIDAEWLKYPDVEVCAVGSPEAGQFNGNSVWILSGERMFLNCDNPKMIEPKEGDAISVLIWACVNGYYVEIERTILMGTATDIQTKAVEDIMAIRQDLLPMFGPDKSVNDIYQRCSHLMREAGYGKPPPRIGHSMGLGAHESLSVSGGSSTVMRPGMVFTLEPHFSKRPFYRTQFSDTVLITESGYELLTTPSKLEDLKINTLSLSSKP